MNENNNIVNSELTRLKAMGWYGTSLDNHESRAMNFRGKISFPESILCDESINSCAYGEYRNEIIYDSIIEYTDGVLWEIGAGNGDVTSFLFKRNVPIIAVEPHFSGARIINNKGILTFCNDLENLKLPENSCSNFGLFDVLEHIDKDSEFLNLLQTKIVRGGKLFITVPTHQIIFSDFDHELGHYRRYSRKELVRKINNAGFLILETKFFMKALIIPAFILRKIWARVLKLTGKDKLQRVQLRRDFKNASLPFFVKLIKFTDRILPNRFGLSLLIVCTKI
jgi:hypothetical protein